MHAREIELTGLERDRASVCLLLPVAVLSRAAGSFGVAVQLALRDWSALDSAYEPSQRDDAA